MVVIKTVNKPPFCASIFLLIVTPYAIHNSRIIRELMKKTRVQVALKDQSVNRKGDRTVSCGAPVLQRIMSDTVLELHILCSFSQVVQHPGNKFRPHLHSLQLLTELQLNGVERTWKIEEHYPDTSIGGIHGFSGACIYAWYSILPHWQILLRFHQRF